MRSVCLSVVKKLVVKTSVKTHMRSVCLSVVQTLVVKTLVQTHMLCAPQLFCEP